MMYIGYLNGKFSGGFYPEDIILPMVLNVLSDVSYGFLCYIFMFLLRGRLNFPYYFLHVILPEVVYTTLMTIFLYPLILFVNTRLDRPKKGVNRNLFERIKEKLIGILTSRVTVMVLIAFALAGILLYRLFNCRL